jgi:hypothetical protein
MSFSIMRGANRRKEENNFKSKNEKLQDDDDKTLSKEKKKQRHLFRFLFSWCEWQKKLGFQKKGCYVTLPLV